MASNVTREVEAVCVGCRRLTGEWPETARPVYGDVLPPKLIAEGERARAAFLALGEAAYCDRGAALR